MHDIFVFIKDLIIGGGSTLGVIAGGIGSILILKKYFISAFSTVTTLLEKIDKIHYEMNHNGGGSIKDTVSRIDAKQDAYMQLANSCIFECDHNGKIIKANRALCSLFDVNEEILLGNGMFNMLHPNDSDRARKDWQDAVQHDTEITRKYRLKDNRFIEIHAIFTRRFINNKEIVTTINGKVNII